MDDGSWFNYLWWFIDDFVIIVLSLMIVTTLRILTILINDEDDDFITNEVDVIDNLGNHWRENGGARYIKYIFIIYYSNMCYNIEWPDLYRDFSEDTHPSQLSIKNINDYIY